LKLSALFVARCEPLDQYTRFSKDQASVIYKEALPVIDSIKIL